MSAAITDSSRCPWVASHRGSGRNLSGTSESSSIGSRLCHVVWGFVTADKMASADLDPRCTSGVSSGMTRAGC